MPLISLFYYAADTAGVAVAVAVAVSVAVAVVAPQTKGIGEGRQKIIARFLSQRPV